MKTPTFVPKSTYGPTPAGRRLIHLGPIRSSDLWWGEVSGLWLPVYQHHIGQPAQMLPHPLARLVEEDL